VDVPAEENSATASMLERSAAQTPDTVMATFPDGSSWTYRQALKVARRSADALYDSGVREGDRVGVALPEGAAALCARLGISAVGAVMVPIDTSRRGTALASLLGTIKPALIVSAGQWAENLRAVGSPPILDADELTAGNR
jgi:carnitine-CoA ligase